MDKCLECTHWKPCFNGKEWDAAIASPCKYFSPNIIVGCMTNANSIRAMSDEELAAWLVGKTVYQESAFSVPSYLNFLTESDDTKESAIKGTVEWLKQPVQDGGEE
jgi:hypothetical protein